MHDFRRLDVWHRTVDLAVTVYRCTARFPGAERFGLTSQMRRAAVSMMSNTAEGAGRHSTKDILHFLSMARGSASELEAQAILSHRLGLLDVDSMNQISIQADEVRAMLVGFGRNLRASKE